jgi:predicted SprT family Zn-dependent metalloprotease
MQDSELNKVLVIEFDRLNDTFFDGKMQQPSIEFSTRKSYGGYYQRDKNRIVLSWQAYQEHGLIEVLNTFRHEVAHMAHFDHSPEFWRLAEAMGCTKRYAANPIKPVQRRQRYYLYICPSCGARVNRHQKIRNASCALCDKRYNPRFQLKLIETGLTSVHTGSLSRFDKGDGDKAPALDPRTAL